MSTRSLKLMVIATALVLLVGTTGCLEEVGMPQFFSGYNFTLVSNYEWTVDALVEGPGIYDQYWTRIYAFSSGTPIGVPAQGEYWVRLYIVGGNGRPFTDFTARVSDGGANPHYLLTSVGTVKRID